MIFDAIDDDYFAACFTDQISDYTLQDWPPRFIDYRIPVFYRKNRLNINLHIGICHWIWFLMYRLFLFPRIKIRGYNMDHPYGIEITDP